MAQSCITRNLEFIRICKRERAYVVPCFIFPDFTRLPLMLSNMINREKVGL